VNPAPQFLRLPPERRRAAFEQAATQRGLDPVIIEKDFWVCWLLGVLFAQTELASHVVFKGGTSLSKVFGAIERFSEDVDLSLSPSFVGADVRAFDAGVSRTKRDAAMLELQRLCGITVQETITPMLEAAIKDAIGEQSQGEPWLVYELDELAGSPNLYFNYPATQVTGLSYVRRTVKLELGSLTDQQPVDKHAVRPWVAEEVPAAFPDWQCEVTALDLARSFWEKATILHAEFYRPENEATPARYARHYSDLARLLLHPDAAVFVADKALCAHVADWKSRVFARTWARYDLARHGTFRLVPPDARSDALAEDYASMRSMFLSEPPPFDEVMQQLADAEQEINAMGSNTRAR